MAATSRDVVRQRLDDSLTAGDPVHELLQSTIDATAEHLGVEGSATWAVILHDRPYTVATTDRHAWQADQVEFDTQEGPCMDAMLTGARNVDIDLDTETRWPAWCGVASLLGFRSAAGIPAAYAPGAWLALNLYSGSPRAYDDDALIRAQELADEVAGSLPVVLRLTEQSILVTQLQEALASRSTIDQALGVLMAQNRCSRDDAFGILRRASQNRNVKLREVAGAVIVRFTGHEAPAAPEFRGIDATGARGTAAR